MPGVMMGHNIYIVVQRYVLCPIITCMASGTPDAAAGGGYNSLKYRNAYGRILLHLCSALQALLHSQLPCIDAVFQQHKL